MSFIFDYIFNSEYDAYTYDVIRYASLTDYVHDSGITYKTIYIPKYNLYCHYNDEYKRFIVYKLDEEFNERKSEYKNMRKVKISARFCLELFDEYKATEESKKISASYKDYFNDI
jgi:hypothetical protein